MISLDDLIRATGGVLAGQARATEFTAFAFDSRRLQPGQLFIAVQTPTGDGHDYILEAVTAGATGVLCRQPPSQPPPVTMICVPNPHEALLDYARYILQKYGPPVIGVTGSNGKTTAKEAIATVLGTRFRVFKNFGSFNGRYGLLNLPESRFDLVRCGIGLYGLAPSSQVSLPAGVRPVLRFKTTIAQVKTLPPGSPIGYGATYHTAATETIAIIPVGYADGFRRAPQTWGEVLVKGQRAPLVGRVSMDQAALDVSHIPNVRQGDEVVLIGRQGNEEISVEDVAANLGTINYEVVSQILARVPRDVRF